MARPRLTTAIRFPLELHDRLLAAADERDVSINYLVNKACSDFLDRLLPVDEIRWTRDDPPRRPPTTLIEEGDD